MSYNNNSGSVSMGIILTLIDPQGFEREGVTYMRSFSLWFMFYLDVIPWRKPWIMSKVNSRVIIKHIIMTIDP